MKEEPMSQYLIRQSFTYEVPTEHLEGWLMLQLNAEDVNLHKPPSSKHAAIFHCKLEDGIAFELSMEITHLATRFLRTNEGNVREIFMSPGDTFTFVTNNEVK